MSPIRMTSTFFHDHEKKNNVLKSQYKFRSNPQSASKLLYWLVVWNMFYFPYIGNNHPNWLIFFRGVETTNQYIIKNHHIISCKVVPQFVNAKLVNITSISRLGWLGWLGWLIWLFRLIYHRHMVYAPTNITFGGHHLVEIVDLPIKNCDFP